MSCPRLEQRVFLHAHGQLGGVQGWLVEAHLQHCTVCRAQWAQWTVERDRLRRAFSPLPAEPANLTGLSAAVGARIRAEGPLPQDRTAHPLRRPLSRTTLTMALAVALLAVAISALAAFWQPVVERCRPPAPPAVGTNVPENCPGLHNQLSNAPGGNRRVAPGGPVP